MIDDKAVEKNDPPWRLPNDAKVTLTVSGDGLAGKYTMIELVPGSPHEVMPISVVRLHPKSRSKNLLSRMNRI